MSKWIGGFWGPAILLVSAIAARGAEAPKFVAPKVVAPKVIAYDPTQAVRDFLKTATIEDTNAREKEEEAYDSSVEFSWGAAVTSNYVSSGLTQSDDKPAFQAWGEMQSGIVYAGVWLSTVKLDPDNWEFDLSWGIRPTIGALSLDISYVRYVYDATGNCCGEWIAAADYEVNEKLMLNSAFDWDPQSDGRTATAGLTLSLLEKLEFSAEIERDLVTYENDWDAGFTWSFSDNLSLDLRYYDAEFADPRYVATVAWQGSTSE